MKRYIEIVYDNSGSMNGHIGNHTKYEIAQDLFEKEILPTIGLKGDHIVLRLLGEGCGEDRTNSEALTIGGINNRKSMLDRIKSVNPSHSNTPLFYTILDAVQACKNERADEYLIFVLTDGDDTCKVRIEDLIHQDLINKYVKYYKVLLVQLAISSALSRNNLTAFTSYLGGQTIHLSSDDSIAKMRGKMKKALSLSGFSVKLPLEHCYVNQPGFDLTWDEIESLGIDFHQALLIYNKDLLSWEPDFTKTVTALELAELEFLFGLFFKTGLPDEMVKTMLTQLKKPYYYSNECIYWDFFKSRWKYFKPQNFVQQIDNPEALNDDNPVRDNKPNRDKELFNNNEVYLVKDGGSLQPSFQLTPIYTDINKNIKTLHIGEQVMFK
jgi:hypothetical protein